MVKTSTTLSQAVLAHIHNLDFFYHTNKSSGKLITLMKRGDEAFYTFYDIFNRSFMNLFVSFSIMFFAFAQLKTQYIIFVFLLLIISIYVAWKLVKINIYYRKAFNTIDNSVSMVRVDNLVNFDTVKYFAKEKYEQKRFKKLLEEWSTKLQAYFFTFRYFDVILGNIVNIALIGIMILAIYDLKSGSINLADFLLITTFSMNLSPMLMHLLFNMRELAKKFTDLEDYLNLLDEPISVLDPQKPKSLPSPKGELTFESVAFKYEEKGKLVLKDLTLKIEPGESIAFVGYSGAGKTTIAKLLMRMYDPTKGAILFDGIDIRELSKAHLRSLVGIVPQDPLLFNNTIFYNIAYAKSNATKQEVLQAAKDSKVDDFVKTLPEKYDTVVGERGIKLSGGQRQRLAIARVLLEKPQVIILDEATSALDSVSEQTIQAVFWNLVKNPKRPLTSIIIAHRLSTIMKADKIVVMDKGSVAEVGTHQELIKDTKGIYFKLWSLQKDGFIADGEKEV